MLEEGWMTCILQWDLYVTGTGINEGDKPRQFIHRCEQELFELVLKVDPPIGTKTLAVISETVKKLAVIPVAIGVQRSELFSLKQDRG